MKGKSAPPNEKAGAVDEVAPKLKVGGAPPILVNPAEVVAPPKPRGVPPRAGAAVDVLPGKPPATGNAPVAPPPKPALPVAPAQSWN